MSFFTIPKPGQGKVARLGSAIGFGVVLLGTIFWIVAEVSAVFGYLSELRTEYGAIVAPYSSRPVDGQADSAEIRRLVVSRETALALQSEYGERLAKQDSVTLRIKRDRGRTTSFVMSGLDIPAVEGQNAAIILTQPLYRDLEAGRLIESSTSRNYLVFITVGGGALLVLLSLAFLFWVLNRPKIVDFLIATEDEMRKVNWPSRKEVVGATWVVIFGTVFMAATLWTVDLLFAELFINIGILEGNSTIAALIRSIFPG